MANPLPPVPQDPIGETYKWREWFNIVRNSIVGVGGSVPIVHNSLSSIQGGISAQRWHLTNTEYTDLTSGGYSIEHSHAKIDSNEVLIWLA